MIRGTARPYQKVGLYEMIWLTASAIPAVQAQGQLHEIQHALQPIVVRQR
jgi:hypothetical protein